MISTGTLIKPQFLNYKSTKKNFKQLHKILFIFWQHYADLFLEKFYFYIKSYNFLFWSLLTQLKSMFGVTEIILIINKPKSFITKTKKRIKKRIWKKLNIKWLVCQVFGY